MKMGNSRTVRDEESTGENGTHMEPAQAGGQVSVSAVGIETGEVPQTGMGQSLKEGTALLLGKDRKYKPLAIYMQQQSSALPSTV